MTSLFSNNTRMALQSIRNNKTRSLLTMLGIIIGVSSVILTVALGEGVRNQVSKINATGDERAVTIRTGNIITRDENRNIIDVNYLQAFGNNSLTDNDYQTLSRLSDVATAVPLATISAKPSTFDGDTYQESVVIATSKDLPEALGHKIAYGSIFDSNTTDRSIAVVGKRVAERLYQENVPLGKLITIRGQDFVIGGVFDEFDINPLSPVADLNKAVFIAYDTAQNLIKDDPSIYQILVLPKNDVSPEQLAAAVNAHILDNHGGQQDFTVLTAEEAEIVAQGTVSIATTFIASIAAISLVVGGIGIMNIMFVNVTERTREIGVRKSLGATTQQIYSQFLVESAVLSITGGIIGVLGALAGSAIIGLTSDLQPVVTWQITILAVGVSAGVGIVFGTAPAVKAARKDPIESLRHE